MSRLVAVALSPGPRFVTTLEQIWSDGDALLPLDVRLSPSVQTTLMTAMGASARIDDDGVHQLPSGRPVEPGDALVIATSGTTGHPKGVVLTHGAIVASATITSKALAASPDDHWLSCLPLAHIGGLSVVTRALHTGARLTVLPRFDDEAVAAVDATLISVVPALLSRFDVSRFRAVLLGGAAPPQQLPSNVVATYGMTETGSGVVYDRRPLDGVAVRADQGGQLWIASPTLMRCYRDGTSPLIDGWLPTGDAGAVLDDGSVSVFGRMAEVINTGGQKVWPVAVERVLNQHPSIAASVVHGEPDPTWGERVVATVELEKGASTPLLAELKAAVTEQVAPYAAPKEVRVTASLARTTSGKLRRPQPSTND